MKTPDFLILYVFIIISISNITICRSLFDSIEQTPQILQPQVPNNEHLANSDQVIYFILTILYRTLLVMI